MNKLEFIDILRRNIGQVNDYAFVNETINYYENYIDTQIMKGKSEIQILEELGDPRLIAKSIVASKAAEDSSGERLQEDSEDESGKIHLILGGRSISLPVWAGKLITVVGIIAVIMLLLTAARFILPIFALIMIVRYIRNWFRK